MQPGAALVDLRLGLGWHGRSGCSYCTDGAAATAANGLRSHVWGWPCSSHRPAWHVQLMWGAVWCSCGVCVSSWGGVAADRTSGVFVGHVCWALQQTGKISRL